MKLACILVHYHSPGLLVKAVEALREATDHWRQLAAVTDSVYVEMPLAHIHHFDQEAREDRRTFHWKRLLPEVEAELKRLEEQVDTTK